MKKLRELNRVLQSILKSDKWNIKRYNNTPTVDIYFGKIYIVTTQIAEQSKTKYVIIKKQIKEKLASFAWCYPTTLGIKMTCKLKKK